MGFQKIIFYRNARGKLYKYQASWQHRNGSHLSATNKNINSLFNAEEVSRLEHVQPKDKIILTLNYKKQKLGFIFRNTRFGKTSIHYTDSPEETFSPKS
jgi:hypothetical protein